MPNPAKAPIRVGVVGGNVDAGWAAAAHIPALQALDGYRVSAVCTSRRESADHAAAVLGAEAFLDAGDLARSPNVDVVTVCVKAPDHEAAVRPALEAGKPVFCEWPLGRTTPQAQGMADLARARGLATVVGLQSRVAPELEHVRSLIAGGYLGEVTSAAFYGAYPFWGETVSIPQQADVDQGVNLLTIPGGHTLDALDYLLDDELSRIQAMLATKRRETRVRATGEVLKLTSPDHLALMGTYRRGVILSAMFLGGASCPSTSRIEIGGLRGRLSLEMDGLIENTPIRIRGWRAGAAAEALTPPAGDARTARVPQGSPSNVARMYVRFADQLAGGARSLPDFDHAVKAHRLLDAVRASAEAGGPVEI